MLSDAGVGREMIREHFRWLGAGDKSLTKRVGRCTEEVGGRLRRCHCENVLAKAISIGQELGCIL